MAEELTVSRDADVPVLFRIGLRRTLPYLLARFQQAETHAREIDRKQAQRVLSYAIKLDEAWPQVRDLLIAMAPKMEQAGHRDDWAIYLESGIEKSQKLEDLEAEGELRFHVGVLYEQLTKYDEAYRQLEFSVMYFEQVENSHYQARALNSLAYVVRRQRRFNGAKQLIEVALRLVVEEHKTERAHSYLVLGLIALDQRKLPDAYDWFLKSLTLWEEVNNQRMMAWGLTNLGVVLSLLQKYEDAIAYYKKAINRFEIIKDPVHQAIARMNLGNVYRELNHFELGLEFYLLAQPIFHRTQDKLRLAMLNNNKGMAYQKLQKWEKAKQAYLFSIELWQWIGNIGALVNVIDNLGELYLEQALYHKAQAIFQDALNQLTQIKGEPGYDDLFDMVTTHLRDAIEKST